MGLWQTVPCCWSDNVTMNICFDMSMKQSFLLIPKNIVCFSYLPKYHRSATFSTWGRVTHICVLELGHHWFIYWLVACSAPSHYLNQWSFLVNWTLWTKFSGIFTETKTFSLAKLHLKYRLPKWRPCSLGLNVLSSSQNKVLWFHRQGDYIFDRYHKTSMGVISRA